MTYVNFFFIYLLPAVFNEVRVSKNSLLLLSRSSWSNSSCVVRWPEETRSYNYNRFLEHIPDDGFNANIIGLPTLGMTKVA